MECKKQRKKMEIRKKKIQFVEFIPRENEDGGREEEEHTWLNSGRGEEVKMVSGWRWVETEARIESGGGGGGSGGVVRQGGDGDGWVERDGVECQ